MMTEMTVGGVAVNACKGGCGGLWFDAGELAKLDQPGQSAGQDLLDIPQNPQVKVDLELRRKCPRHPGMVMMRHFSSIKRQVTVDECPKCTGLFLDPGELAEIRGEYSSDEERRRAAAAYYREMFDGKLETFKQDHPMLESAAKVANVFRFLRPGPSFPF
jgi:Zn-finger nucleic acid-binding protein